MTKPGFPLRDMNWMGADLSGADLHGQDLHGANFTGADLRGVDLRGADLSGANFTAANLAGACWSEEGQEAGERRAFTVANSSFYVGGVGVELVSWTPRIFYLHNFLSDEECDYLKEIAKPLLVPSGVSDYSRGKTIQSSVRTSTGCFLEAKQFRQDPALREIEDRISDFVHLPYENGSCLQVLHYGLGQEYQPHNDYYDPSNPAVKKTLDRGGQRFCTVLLYLETPEEGGETYFPKTEHATPPQRGCATIFYSTLPNLAIDPLSHHGSRPVTKGEKWVVTKWLHEREFH